MIMKKVMFMAVAAAAISFASCTSNTNKGTASDADSVKTPVVETQEVDVTKDLSAKLDAKDAAGLQDALNSVNEKIKSLKEEGKLDEAKAMLKQVQDLQTRPARRPERLQTRRRRKQRTRPTKPTKP